MNRLRYYETMYVCGFLFVTVFHCVYSSPVPANGDFTLNIIHYNDFHARFDEFNVGRTTCDEKVGQCIGGFARLYTSIKDLSTRSPHSLILNAGDSFQGTAWYNVLKWNATQHFMNLIPHDAYALGNHEFDSGIEGLVPYMRALTAPFLIANIDAEKVPEMKELFQKSIIVTRKNKKIGIIGVTTTASQTNFRAANLKFLDEKDAVRKEATKLKQQGTDIIIVLSHCGLEADRQIANTTGDLVDIIVGGHSHSLLYTGEPPSHEKVEGDYPVIVNHASGKQILVVQAACYTSYLGQLAVTFRSDGKLISWSGKPLYLDSHIEKNSMILRELIPYREQVKKVSDAIIGYTNVTMNNQDCHSGECVLGDLICEAFLEGARNHSGLKIDLCLTHSGTIRSSFYPGAITFGDLLEALTFNNSMNVYKIKGKYLKRALEHSVSQAWTQKPFVGPYLVQLSGARVVFNMSAPVGSRVKSASVKNAAGSYEDLQNETTYSIVSNEYMTMGGDGFIDISENLEDLRIVGVDINFLEDYIRKNSPLSPKTDGRIVMLQ